MNNLLKLLDCSKDDIINILDLADTTFRIAIWKARASA